MSDTDALEPFSSLPDGDGSLNPIFQRLPLSVFDHPSSQPVFELPSSTTLADAARQLADHNYLSAPVRDVTKPDDESWTVRYCGVVDFMGIVQYMISQGNGKMPATFGELIALHDSFAATTLADFANGTRWGPFVPLDYTHDSALDVLLLLGKYGLHRACTVKSPEGKLVSVVTQSAVLNMLYNNIDTFGSFTAKTIAELGLAKPRHVDAVSSEQTIWDAFKIMSDKVYSAVPVVKDNRLVGNISVKDVRIYLKDNALPKLRTRIADSSDLMPLAYKCYASDTLESVLRKLHDTRIHRVYLVDQQDAVLAVVSLRDIIARMVKEPESSELWKYFAI